MVDMKKRLDLVALALFSIIFFVSSSILIWNNVGTFNSPDENANATFAHAFAVSSTLSFYEPLNLELDNLLHPRSVISIAGSLVPVSFLGVPVLYGLVGKIIGVPLVGLLTPLLMIAAAFAWRSMMERLFASRAIAFLSALAVLFHPGIWYYSARLFMHNVPFTACLILAAFFAIHPRRPVYRLQSTVYVLSGAFLALALWFRTSEVFWVLPGAFLLALFFRARLGFANILLLFFSAALVLSPLPFLNRALYGSPFVSGYTYEEPSTFSAEVPTDTTSAVPSQVSSAPSFLEQLPFSLNLSTVPKH